MGLAAPLSLRFQIDLEAFLSENHCQPWKGFPCPNQRPLQKIFAPHRSGVEIVLGHE